MKETELNKETLQALMEFESLGIHPSSAWNQELMDKLVNTKPISPSIFPRTSIAAIVLFIILVNIGFILKSALHNSNRNLKHNSDLQIISKELLINPVTIKN